LCPADNFSVPNGVEYCSNCNHCGDGLLNCGEECLNGTIDRTVLCINGSVYNTTAECVGCSYSSNLKDSTLIEIPNIQYVNKLLIDNSQSLLYVGHSNGEISLIDISDLNDVQVLERKRVVADDAEITELTFLTGEISLLVGDNNGSISQWFPVQKETGLTLSHIRDFDSQQGSVSSIITEQRRKGFAAIDKKGQLALYHSTAHRTLLHEKVNDSQLNFLAISPRANLMVAEDENQQIQVMQVRLNGKWLTDGQLKAILGLSGRVFTHKWMAAEALAQQSDEWRLLPETILNKAHNKRIKEKLGYVFRTFAFEE